MRVAVVGAGISGIAATIALDRAGVEDVVLFEAADDVGGTWLHNTYPGIACDVPSYLYCFSFAQRSDWERPCPPGEQIHRYVREVADEHGVTPRTRLRTEVVRADFDDEALRWTLETADGAREAFDAVTALPTWFYGVAVYFAAHLVASRDRRAHAGEWLAALPSTARARVTALCLAALVPTAVCAVVVAVGHSVLLSTQEYFIPPTSWHLAQAPVTVLGGALLGTMVARWTSVPGVALLVMTSMVLVDAWLNNRPQTVQTLATYVPWTAWPESGTAWAGFIGGSPAWHVAYLLALCGMAASGAFLRGVGATRAALVAGGLFTLAAVLTGLAQLP